MKRILFFLYGVVAYLVFFGTFLYAIGFVGNLFVPKGIDGEPTVDFTTALINNAVLLGIFAIQHSVMARQGFKRWWTKIIPPEIERSTYVLISSLLLILLFSKWEPMGGVIWNVEDQSWSVAICALFFLGWGIVLLSSFLINHFDLFGLRQVWLQLQGKPYTPVTFRTPLFYKWVRHPLYLGFIIAFWAIPKMTVAHLVFAIATTAYILIAAKFFEEKDLVRFYGEQYKDYQRRVSMIIPMPPKKSERPGVLSSESPAS
ncbi:MAG: isoprenylcysteine carboxylmethyltransferase family protein [Bacteroidetes bacterium]|nr:MAG: isoprenylcysteine carboxylmethyltransferase family protein [Bacteroidota bacterium]